MLGERFVGGWRRCVVGFYSDWGVLKTHDRLHIPKRKGMPRVTKYVTIILRFVKMAKRLFCFRWF